MVNRFPDYRDHDGLGLAALLRKRAISPQELLETAIDWAERVNPPINAANGYESEGHVGVSGTFAGSACTLTVTGGLVTGASC